MEGIKNCDICSVPFKRHKKLSQKQWDLRRFCSFSCNGKFNSKNLKGRKWDEAHRRSEKIKVAARSMGFANRKANAISYTPAYRNAKYNEYRSRSLNAEGKFTHEEWMEVKLRYGCKCAHCERPETIVKLTIDHIVPLTKGGSNWPSNLQPLCQPCNSRKGNRI